MKERQLKLWEKNQRGIYTKKTDVALTFLLSLIVLPLLSILIPSFIYLFLGEIILYSLLDIISSIKAAKDNKYIPLLFILFPIFHLSYGFGSLIGLAKKI